MVEHPQNGNFKGKCHVVDFGILMIVYRLTEPRIIDQFGRKGVKRSIKM